MTEDKKPIVTFVGSRQAKKGFSFLNEGALKECEKCERLNLCIEKLEERRVYIVTGVRDKIFPCEVHEEGVRVVTVNEANAEAIIENRLAFPGGIITFTPQECAEISCPNYAKCVPVGLKSGDKCRVVEVKKQTECPLNLRLVSAILQRVAD